MIGLIFAMKEELEATKKYFELKKERKIFELTFYEGTIKDKDIVMVECGIGKVNAGRTTQILIDNYNLKCIINIGVAGGVDERLKILDLVVGTSFVQHDFDITAFNHKKGYIPNLGDIIENKYDLIDIAIKSFNNKEHMLYKGTIASGDIFVTDKNMSNKIHNKFNALCVDMESSAIAQVCHLCNIPYLIIRSISDVPNNNNYITYEDFLELSCAVVAKYIINVIKNI